MAGNSKYNVIGMMSGTSLDGLDIALCEFIHSDNQWQYSILSADCLSYTDEWSKKIELAHLKKSGELEKLHFDYGKELGIMLNKFLKKHHISTETIDFTASHGHTVFHQPENRKTLQIGHGQEIANITGMPVVWDFRTADVEMGGQGAPLVPVGDALLFAQYEQCLNLGGFSNISYNSGNSRIAYDICPVNFVLNHLASKLGYPYDKDGGIAAGGKLIPELFDKLESIDYYRQDPPKSLGREWVEKQIFPLINTGKYEIQDMMHTFGKHIVARLSPELKGKVLVTGGGAANLWLMEELRRQSEAKIHIPGKETLEYKEALIFAFLGILRWEGKNNILASVTGAPYDHSAGEIAFPQKESA